MAYVVVISPYSEPSRLLQKHFVYFRVQSIKKKIGKIQAHDRRALKIMPPTVEGILYKGKLKRNLKAAFEWRRGLV